MTTTLTECPDCEKHFAGTRCACGYRKPSAEREGLETWETPSWLRGPKPCTAEQNYRAGQLVQAVLRGEVTPEQAHRCLGEIFPGLELAESSSISA